MSLDALSPLDGRYQAQVAPIAADFSEAALIRARVAVEVAWLRLLAARPELVQVRPLTAAETAFLEGLVRGFDSDAAEAVKTIEQTTRHDVKAVEYWLKAQLAETSLADVAEFVHFACTSEDINNLAYGLLLRHAVRDVWLPEAERLTAAVAAQAEALAALPMLSHTHGQPASPTTVGKELAVFVARWQRQLAAIRAQPFLGKLNGAVGNFNAHAIAYPEAPWPAIARAFVESLGLTYNPLTTQVESHDGVAEICHALARFNTITVDFVRDCWFYIALGYFAQRVAPGAVGSSTMPHKVNPIQFENAEANLELSTSLLLHLATKLPVSRLQRDLTDSSTMRNLGAALGHSYLALGSALRGFGSLAADRAALEADLLAHWEVLAEAVQTVMRKAGLPLPYEQLKALTQGTGITAEALRAFIAELDLPEADRARLLALTPLTYTGLATALAETVAPADAAAAAARDAAPSPIALPATGA